MNLLCTVDPRLSGNLVKRTGSPQVVRSNEDLLSRADSLEFSYSNEIVLSIKRFPLSMYSRSSLERTGSLPTKSAQMIEDLLYFFSSSTRAYCSLLMYHHGKEFSHILIKKWQFEMVFRSEVMPLCEIKMVHQCPKVLLLVHLKTGHYLWLKYLSKLSSPNENGAELFSMRVQYSLDSCLVSVQEGTVFFSSLHNKNRGKERGWFVPHIHNNITEQI